jgi:membrane associated rhomboid family serine protease
MIPLKDDNPTRIVPLVTLALIAANVAVFLWELSLVPAARERAILRLAVVPSRLTGAAPAGPDGLVSGALALLTAMFVHGGLLHLAGNMLYLWIFGNNVEEIMGHWRFLVFYVLCGLAGSFTQIAASPASHVPMIGASGAIAGVLGAYMILFPAARVLTLIFVFFFARIVAIPAFIVLGFWLLLQLVSAGQITPGGVAWFAHLGGFTAGLLLLVPFRRKRPRQSLY